MFENNTSRESGVVPGARSAGRVLLQWCLLLAGIVCGAVATTAGAANFSETGFGEKNVGRPDGAANWNEAVGLTFSASGRMFVWERAGRVWIVDGANPVPRPFLDINDEVLAWRDHGMLGFALDPAFERNGYVYVLYAVDPYHLFNCDSPASGATVCAAGYDAGKSWNADDPASGGSGKATIGRVARFTALKPAGDADFRRASQIDAASRRVLIGETVRNQPKGTGIPLLSGSQGVGSLLFGRDGSLLVSTGDGASATSVDVGSAGDSYFQSALTDGIIRQAENVGALRAQLVDSLNGKVLRINPANGDGYATNPYYDGTAPRAARSRVWARGFRNPVRIALRPDTGSASAAAGDPGVIVLGDVGRESREELDVVDVAGGNYGWPLYEGLTPNAFGSATTVANRDAPNPLAAGGECAVQHFRFGDLLVQDSFSPVALSNPCDAIQRIPVSANPSRHLRPALDWPHDAGQFARWGTYAEDGSALALPLGVAAPRGSVVNGGTFTGITAAAGVFLQGTGLPAGYPGRFVFGDSEGEWIRTLELDASNQPLAVQLFASGTGRVIAFGDSPLHEGFYYITGSSQLRHVTHDLPPVAAASGTPLQGTSPLTVQFSSAGSNDPDGGAVTYAWDFGDGATSTAANPKHVYSVSEASTFEATLTVQETQGLTSARTLRVSVGVPDAVDGAGSSAGSSSGPETTASVASPPRVRALSLTAASPGAPTGLSAAALGKTEIRLSWAPAADGGTGIAGYRILRNGIVVGTTAPATLTFTDTGLSASTNYVYTVIAFDGATPANDSPPSSAVTASTASSLVRMRASNNWSHTDSLGQVWLQDSGYNTGAISTFTAPIANTIDDGLYQSERYVPSGYANMRYSLSVPNGTYIVNLHFAENWHTSAMSRVFDVDIEGVRRFEDIDILAEAGWRTALVKSATAVVTDGEMNITFVRQTGDPLINAIELVGLGETSVTDVTAPTVPAGVTATPHSTTQVRITWNASSDPGGLGVAGYRVLRGGVVVQTVSAGTLAYIDNGLTPNTTYAYQVVAFDNASPANVSEPSAQVTAGPASLVTRIRAGGSTFTDSQGTVWGADSGYNTGIPNSFNQPIAGTAEDALYQSERYDAAAAPDLEYAFAVPNGDYQVRLHFAENWHTSAMSRVFDVDMENLRSFEDVDIFAQAGYRTALVKSAVATVADGQLNIRFVRQAGDPLVNAIEIVAIGQLSDTTPPSIPTGVTAIAQSQTSIRVTWNASTDNVGVGGYQVVRNGVVIASTDASTLGYVDTGLNPNTYYTYRIAAFDTASPPNVSLQSMWSSARTTAADVAPPSVPTGVTAAGVSTSQIALAWNASTDTGGSGMGGYRVLRNGGLVATLDAGVLSYTDGSLSAGTTYTYQIQAYDAATPANVSAASASVTGRTLSPDTTAPTQPLNFVATVSAPQEIRLTWDASTDIGTGVAGYRVLRGGVLIATTTASVLSYTDGGLAANTAYTYQVVAFDNALPANVSWPNSLTASTAAVALRIKAGRDPFTDSQGRVWAADHGFNTGNVNWFSAQPIEGTVEDGLYHSERWDQGSAPELQYSFNVINGRYEVRLHFAENWVTYPGARVFDVDIEGVRRFEDVDIFGEAGFRTALVKSAVVYVSDGQLNIGFVHQVDNPLINAIEITGLPAIVDTVAPTVPTGVSAQAESTSQIRVSWAASNDGDGTGVGGYRILRNGVVVGTTPASATSYLDRNLQAGVAYTYTVAAFDNAFPVNVSVPSAAVTVMTATTTMLINAGGVAFSDSQGRSWTSDIGYNTGQTSSFTYDPIAGTPDQKIYQTERYDTWAAPDLEYALPVPAGNYLVRLHFAENWASAAGMRVFGVDVEGVRRIDNFDIYAQVGRRVATTRTVALAVVDGMLNIRFVRQVGDPMVNGIEVHGLGAVVDQAAPSMPPGVRATALSTHQVRVDWDAASDTGSGVGGYRVSRDGVQIGVTAAGVLTYADAGLTAGTTYSYTVVAFDNASPANVSEASAPASVTTLGAETTPPSAPSGLTTTLLATTQIRLIWGASTDAGGSGLAGYRVLRDGVFVGSTAAGTLTWIDTTVTGSTTYTYTVVAFDNATPANVSAASNPAVITTPLLDTTAPSAPTGLSTVARGTTSIWVSWNPSTDAGTGVAGYRVYRNNSLVATTNAITTSYTDSWLTASTAYQYSVRAFDNALPANVSDASQAVTGTTAAVTLRIRANDLAYTDVQGQTWAKGSGNWYGFSNVTTHSEPISGTDDDALYQGERYAINANDLHYASSVPVGIYQVRLHFAENWATSAGTRIFDVDINGVRRFDDVDVFAEAGFRAALVKTANVLVTDGVIRIILRRQAGDPMVNAIELVGLGPVVDDTPPTVPGGVTVTALTESQVRVAWTASTDLEGYGVAGYRILRNGVPLTDRYFPDRFYYVDTTASANTTYQYSVAAIDGKTPRSAANVSAPSAAVSVTTPARVLRLRAGQTANVADSMERVWGPDTGFNTGQTTNHYSPPIAGTVDDFIYYYERYDTSASPDLEYTFNVPNGSYLVRLMFAENWATYVGQRTFDVNIEGERRLDNIDVLAEAGYRTALVKTFGVYVADGQLNIVFGRRVGDPFINAIEITGLTPTADTNPPGVPSGLAATPLSATQVRLSWNASSDGDGTGVAGYRLLRNGVAIVTTPVGTTSYVDTGLAASTSYEYTVQAFDYASPANVSLQSAAVSTSTGTNLPDITSTIAPPHSSVMVNRESQNYLRANGTHLTTASGQNVQLRGLNIGGWLTMENWMNGFSDWADESGTQPGRSAVFTLESRFGPTQAAELMNIWQDHWMTTRDMDRIRDAGFNLIRVPFSYRTLQKADNSWILDASGRIDFSHMDWIVREAASRGIYVIFDLHVWPGQRYDYQNIGRPANVAVRNQMATLWEVVAAHYRGNGTVAAFDVINELPGGWGVHQQLVAAIRRADPSRTVVIEGFNYADFRPVYDAGTFPNSVFSQHFYETSGDPGVSSADFQSRLQQLSGAPMPVYIGEFLADDFGYAARTMNAGNIHWSSWTYKTVGMGAWGMLNYDSSLRTDLQRDSFETIRNRWLSDFTSGDAQGGTPNFTINAGIRAAP